MFVTGFRRAGGREQERKLISKNSFFIFLSVVSFHYDEFLQSMVNLYGVVYKIENHRSTIIRYYSALPQINALYNGNLMVYVYNK